MEVGDYMPKFNDDIIGKKVMQHCGMNATCIAYRGNKDIDIKFEDGTVVYHKTKIHFINGGIANPNINIAAINGKKYSIVKRDEVLNKSIIMKNGQAATCINYNNAKDIDVKFEDGTIVYHKTKNCFINGSISNPNFNPSSCIGVTVMQKCGMKATCILYRNSKDIDIQFEDGIIIKHRSKTAFLEGSIQNPNLALKGQRLKDKASCLNQRFKQKCGMEAVCIKYNNCKDIDIQFEDGAIVFHRSKTDFVRGLINNPNLPVKISLEKMNKIIEKRIEKSSCLGETIMQKCGMSATCIADRNSSDLDVQFEDGVIVYKRRKISFKRGKINNPSFNNKSCLGITIEQKCGMKATCIAYRKAKDIDIQFEDGTIVEHRIRYEFLNGRVGNPNINHNARNAIVYSNQVKNKVLNKSVVMNNGQQATCIAYRNARDIDIQFEDGTIVEHKNKAEFIRGEIGNPNFTALSLPQRIIFECLKHYFNDVKICFRPDWLKNTKTNFNLEIDIWIPSKKFGIEYDGYPWHESETELSKLKYNLVCHSNEIVKLYSFIEAGCKIHESSKHINFLMKCNSHSNKIEYYKELEYYINELLNMLGINDNIILSNDFLNDIKTKSLNYILGETKLMNCGMKATCIVYRDSNDIDVQFEDGTIVQHKSKNSFDTCSIRNPNYSKSSCKGTVKMQHCGMNATCIAYRRANDIDVQFEDGLILYHRGKGEFLDGRIRNRNLKVKKLNLEKNSCLGETRLMNCGMKATCIAYRGTNDIDVKFEDNTVVYHRRKSHFYDGGIKNPNYKVKKI